MRDVIILSKEIFLNRFLPRSKEFEIFDIVWLPSGAVAVFIMV